MASIAGDRQRYVLTQSRPLRLLTLLLFYFTQGFPLGLFYYAIPTWMASNGMSTTAVAGVVGASALPWSMKLINGFLIDRYTFLPMGRRRSWIIGAQFLIVLSLLAGAVISPDAADVFMLSALGFAANAAVTFQDVGIDSLAVDIMPEDERAKAAGIMGGAQLVGMAVSTAGGGYLIAEFGISACLLGCALVPAGVMLYGTVVREREGERRLPWTHGEAHPANRAIQVQAWWPLLVNAARALVVPVSLMVLPILLFRSLPWGGFESFHPILYTQTAGWDLTDYTNYTASLNLGFGIFAVVLGGVIVERIGAQWALRIALVIGLIALFVMGFLEDQWSDSRVLVGFQLLMELAQIFYFIAMLAICMRLCSPAVAATQFTIYMAVGNFGRPMGASFAAATAGAGNPQWFYWGLGMLWLVGTIIVIVVRFPSENRAQHQLAEELPQGEGLPPRID